MRKGMVSTMYKRLTYRVSSLPVASMAVLLWIEYLSTKTPYYETYYRSADIPLPHHLLDEIAYQHPLQRPQVLEVIEHCLSHSYENFAPEILVRRWQGVCIFDNLSLPWFHFSKHCKNGGLSDWYTWSNYNTPSQFSNL